MTLIPSKEIRPGQEVDLTDTDLISRISKALIDGMKEHGPAIGLSAVQLGYEWNMFIMNFEIMGYEFSDFSIPMVTFINTEYSSKGQKGRLEEGCLSLPGYTWNVPRYRHVNIKGHYWGGIDAKPFKLNLLIHPLACVGFQHEIDHQHGIMIDKIGCNRRMKMAPDEVEPEGFNLDNYDVIETNAAGVPIEKTREEKHEVNTNYKESKGGIILPDNSF